MVLPLAQGPAGPVCTAAAWSPALCRKPASKFHEVPSGWADSCDVPKEQIEEKSKNPVVDRKGKVQLYIFIEQQYYKCSQTLTVKCN